eukprot:ANDGO_03805.mRNA.2 hypothetical protein
MITDLEMAVSQLDSEVQRLLLNISRTKQMQESYTAICSLWMGYMRNAAKLHEDPDFIRGTSPPIHFSST